MAYWDKITSRGNVEDRRGIGGGTAIGGAGLVGLLIVLAVNLLSGGQVNIPSDVLNQLQQTQGSKSQSSEFAGADTYEQFASAVLGSSNDLWSGIFAQSGKSYTPPKLVLFRSVTASGCGIASSQVGPHYCPRDQTIYLDETFFDELTNRLGAKGGDVAEAYVIAHEAGHHSQNLLGIMDNVLSRQSASEANDLSIKLELQADCFAGLWAYSVSNLGVFESGEINEALDAAAAVGDDRIQQAVEGQVNPETWTHGSSEQRVSWFNKGFVTGKPADCNTF